MNYDIPYKIINRYNINLLILFGSTGTRFEKKDSDLDLAFLTKEMLTEEEEYNMLNDLIFYYKRDDIDLINLHKADPGLKLAVSRKGRVIYEEKNAFTDFQLYASHIYADTKYLRKMREETLKERIEKL